MFKWWRGKEQNPQCGILPVAEYVYSSYAFYNWENNCVTGSGNHCTHCEMDLSENSIDRSSLKSIESGTVD